MKKYKVLVPFYKLSDKKNYLVDDEVELDIEYAVELMKLGYISVIDDSKPAKKDKK